MHVHAHDHASTVVKDWIRYAKLASTEDEADWFVFADDDRARRPTAAPADPSRLQHLLLADG